MVQRSNTIVIRLMGMVVMISSFTTAFIPSSASKHAFLLSTSPKFEVSISVSKLSLDDNTNKQINMNTNRNMNVSIADMCEASMKTIATLSLSMALLVGGSTTAFADTAASATAKYDGFAEYAKENKMEKSDVGCFMNKCGDQTKNLFSNPRGIKGVSWCVVSCNIYTYTYFVVICSLLVFSFIGNIMHSILLLIQLNNLVYITF